MTVYQDGAGTVAAQPVQGAEQARLAAPRGPQKGHELSLGEAEADVPQDLEPPPVAALVAEPDTVKLEANIPYAGNDNPRQRVNLLLPTTPKDGKPLPVIAHIHGGAWSGGLPKPGETFRK